jgi:hypothetical protein
MFQLSGKLTELLLEHRHSDGSWGRLERAHHDPADHDMERSWKQAGIYVCSTCDEQVRIGIRDVEDEDAAGG